MTAYCIGFRVRSFDITLGVYLFSTEARGTSFGNDLNRDRLTVQYNPFDLSVRKIGILHLTSILFSYSTKAFTVILLLILVVQLGVLNR